MKRQDDVTIILDGLDKVLVTQYEDGGIGLHNTGYALQMPREIAQELTLDLIAIVFPNDAKEMAG